MIDNPYYSPAFHGDYELVGVGRLDLADGGTIPDCHLAVATYGSKEHPPILVQTW